MINKLLSIPFKPLTREHCIFLYIRDGDVEIYLCNFSKPSKSLNSRMEGEAKVAFKNY